MNGGLIVLLKGYGSKRPFHGVIRSVGTPFPGPEYRFPAASFSHAFIERSRLAGFFTASVLLG